MAALELVLGASRAEAGSRPRIGRSSRGLELLAANGRPLVLANDRADAALAAGADGVHVGAEDLPPSRIRELPGGDRLVVGATAHDAAELRRGLAGAADYVGLGPFHPSPTKPTARGDPRAALRELGGPPARPIFAIGGLTLARLPEIRESAAIGGVVVSSAIQRARDPAAEVRAWRASLDDAIPSG